MRPPFRINKDTKPERLNRIVRDLYNGLGEEKKAREKAIKEVSGQSFQGSTNPLSETLGVKKRGDLTIASGEVTVDGSYHDIIAENTASADDLDTINGMREGQIAFLGRDSTNTGNINITDGVGNITTVGGTIVMGDDTALVMAFKRGSTVIVKDFSV